MYVHFKTDKWFKKALEKHPLRYVHGEYFYFEGIGEYHLNENKLAVDFQTLLKIKDELEDVLSLKFYDSVIPLTDYSIGDFDFKSLASKLIEKKFVNRIYNLLKKTLTPVVKFDKNWERQNFLLIINGILDWENFDEFLGILDEMREILKKEYAKLKLSK